MAAGQGAEFGGRLRIDNAMLGCENAVKFYHTSAVDYQFDCLTRWPRNRVMLMTQTRCSNLSTAKADDAQLVVSDSEGLQLHRSRNLFQLASLLIFAGVGATIGWFLTDDRPDIAALVGGVLGMIVGTFISGFVLMLLPAPTIKITPQEFGRKHRALKRRLIIASITFAVCIFGLPFMISRFGHDDSNLAWCICFMWIGLTAGLCAYTKGLAHRLREWKCPFCGKPFDRIGSSCGDCGLPNTAGQDK